MAAAYGHTYFNLLVGYEMKPPLGIAIPDRDPPNNHLLPVAAADRHPRS